MKDYAKNEEAFCDDSQRQKIFQEEFKQFKELLRGPDERAYQLFLREQITVRASENLVNYGPIWNDLRAAGGDITSRVSQLSDSVPAALEDCTIGFHWPARRLYPSDSHMPRWGASCLIQKIWVALGGKSDDEIGTDVPPLVPGFEDDSACRISYREFTAARNALSNYAQRSEHLRNLADAHRIQEATCTTEPQNIYNDFTTRISRLAQSSEEQIFGQLLADKTVGSQNYQSFWTTLAQSQNSVVSAAYQQLAKDGLVSNIFSQCQLDWLSQAIDSKTNKPQWGSKCLLQKLWFAVSERKDEISVSNIPAFPASHDLSVCTKRLNAMKNLTQLLLAYEANLSKLIEINAEHEKTDNQCEAQRITKFKDSWGRLQAADKHKGHIDFMNAYQRTSSNIGSTPLFTMQSTSPNANAAYDRIVSNGLVNALFLNWCQTRSGPAYVAGTYNAAVGLDCLRYMLWAEYGGNLSNVPELSSDALPPNQSNGFICEREASANIHTLTQRFSDRLSDFGIIAEETAAAEQYCGSQSSRQSLFQERWSALREYAKSSAETEFSAFAAEKRAHYTTTSAFDDYLRNSGPDVLGARNQLATLGFLAPVVLSCYDPSNPHMSHYINPETNQASWGADCLGRTLLQVYGLNPRERIEWSDTPQVLSNRTLLQCLSEKTHRINELINRYGEALPQLSIIATSKDANHAICNGQRKETYESIWARLSNLKSSTEENAFSSYLQSASRQTVSRKETWDWISRAGPLSATAHQRFGSFANRARYFENCLVNATVRIDPATKAPLWGARCMLAELGFILFNNPGISFDSKPPLNDSTNAAKCVDDQLRLSELDKWIKGYEENLHRLSDIVSEGAQNESHCSNDRKAHFDAQWNRIIAIGNSTGEKDFSRFVDERVSAAGSLVNLWNQISNSGPLSRTAFQQFSTLQQVMRSCTSNGRILVNPSTGISYWGSECLARQLFEAYGGTAGSSFSIALRPAIPAPPTIDDCVKERTNVVHSRISTYESRLTFLSNIIREDDENQLYCKSEMAEDFKNEWTKLAQIRQSDEELNLRNAVTERLGPSRSLSNIMSSFWHYGPETQEALQSLQGAMPALTGCHSLPNAWTLRSGLGAWGSECYARLLLNAHGLDPAVQIDFSNPPTLRIPATAFECAQRRHHEVRPAISAYEKTYVHLKTLSDTFTENLDFCSGNWTNELDQLWSTLGQTATSEHEANFERWLNQSLAQGNTVSGIWHAIRSDYGPQAEAASQRLRSRINEFQNFSSCRDPLNGEEIKGSLQEPIWGSKCMARRLLRAAGMSPLATRSIDLSSEVKWPPMNETLCAQLRFGKIRGEILAYPETIDALSEIVAADAENHEFCQSNARIDDFAAKWDTLNQLESSGIESAFAEVLDSRLTKVNSNAQAWDQFRLEGHASQTAYDKLASAGILHNYLRWCQGPNGRAIDSSTGRDFWGSQCFRRQLWNAYGGQLDETPPSNAPALLPSTVGFNQCLSQRYARVHWAIDAYTKMQDQLQKITNRSHDNAQYCLDDSAPREKFLNTWNNIDQFAKSTEELAFSQFIHTELSAGKSMSAIWNQISSNKDPGVLAAYGAFNQETLVTDLYRRCALSGSNLIDPNTGVNYWGSQCMLQTLWRIHGGDPTATLSSGTVQYPSFATDLNSCVNARVIHERLDALININSEVSRHLPSIAGGQAGAH
jgi:hypothetical protein